MEPFLRLQESANKSKESQITRNSTRSNRSESLSQGSIRRNETLKARTLARRNIYRKKLVAEPNHISGPVSHHSPIQAPLTSSPRRMTGNRIPSRGLRNHSGHSTDNSIKTDSRSSISSHRGGLSPHATNTTISTRGGACGMISLGDSTASFFSDNNEQDDPVFFGSLDDGQAVAEQEERRTLEAMVSEAQAAFVGPENNQDDGTYEMEVSPGCYMPLRGVKETVQHIQTKTSLESICLECGIQLISVPDCVVVVCPDCRMVNPIFERPEGMESCTPVGVGIGFKEEWISQTLAPRGQHMTTRNAILGVR